ncbi:MAG TPA: sigma-54 dependent transcriptional regulator [Chthoniobacterales bacterium]|jgi:DNA-binding NtrC family response regulator|nr:sigma-54 dependent transcriptional regulator [Chthoniobacterales bacterium]
MSESVSQIYVVDDDVSVREAVGSLIRSAGFSGKTFASAQEMLASLREELPSCLVLDIQLPDINGFELQRELATKDIQIPIIFLTGHGDIPMSVRAIKAGALEFLTKPFDDEYLLEAIRSAIARDNKNERAPGAITKERFDEFSATDRAPRAMPHQPEIVISSHLNGSGKAAAAFGEIIGQSRASRQIIRQIEMVAPTDATVLVLGETGTGKELIARELHRRSRRKDKPLVRVNCASIPKALYESEFFGHARGSFTGAVKDRIGRFEAAAGGTLFLDEIGEIPLELQSKLLRVLQEKCYERVGEERTRCADVRIVAATNRDLKKEVAAGRFREDLYYRLNVFPVKVAALRDRKEDIPLLAAHFIDLSVKELGCPRPRLTRAGIETLQNYDWPGNIRELRNVIERAAIFAQGGALDFDLPATGVDLNSFVLEDGNEVEPEYLTDAEMRSRERENLFAVLRRTSWKIKGVDGAAELLGLKPTTLISRIEKMGLKRPA